MNNKDFIEWLKNSLIEGGKRKLSEASARKYAGGLKRINSLILKKKISDKKIEFLPINQLEMVRDKVLSDEDFLKFDSIGKHMYSKGLKRYVCFKIQRQINSVQSLEEDFNNINNDSSLTESEKWEWKKSRIGQGKYRKELIKIFKNTCFVTGINIDEVLVASHIKPWCSCKKSEKVDENNGLLLSATIDKLFDSGLITFLENGELLISCLVPTEQAKKIGIFNHKKFNIIFNSKQKEYLRYHNSNKFVDNLNQ